MPDPYAADTFGAVLLVIVVTAWALLYGLAFWLESRKR